MTRVLILLGITALACRDKEAPKPATPGSAAVAVSAPAPVPKPRADKAPELLPGFGSDKVAVNVEDRFKNEDVDVAWKSHVEADLKKRLAKHPPSELECKASVCRLAITGSEADISAAIDDMQSLHDAAQSLTLSRPDPTKVVAYLTYERAD
ncbi:MAG: hypothetical protein JO257_13220 [Deltaproteobacteria bacterium]|nr:hypothetical protein [Deltaproteobacteria bacterium]